MILFSVFTDDVQDNPFQCAYGAYYENGESSNSYDLKLLSEEGNFMKVLLLKEERPVDVVYMEKKWIETDKEEIVVVDAVW